jgi:hypothetical protein
MTHQEMAQWIDSRIWGPCHQGYVCDDFDCEQARYLADMLSRMVPSKGTDDNGTRISGWLVPNPM